MPTQETCFWVFDPITYTWTSECDHDFVFKGTLKNNGFVYCPFCGLRLIEEK